MRVIGVNVVPDRRTLTIKIDSKRKTNSVRNPPDQLTPNTDFVTFLVPLKARRFKKSPVIMPWSHIHGSPRRFYYELNLTDDPGNAQFRSPIRMHYIRMIKYYYV